MTWIPPFPASPPQRSSCAVSSTTIEASSIAIIAITDASSHSPQKSILPPKDIGPNPQSQIEHHAKENQHCASRGDCSCYPTYYFPHFKPPYHQNSLAIASCLLQHKLYQSQYSFLTVPLLFSCHLLSFAPNIVRPSPFLLPSVPPVWPTRRPQRPRLSYAKGWSR